METGVESWSSVKVIKLNCPLRIAFPKPALRFIPHPRTAPNLRRLALCLGLDLSPFLTLPGHCRLSPWGPEPGPLQERMWKFGARRENSAPPPHHHHHQGHFFPENRILFKPEKENSLSLQHGERRRKKIRLLENKSDELATAFSGNKSVLGWFTINSN